MVAALQVIALDTAQRERQFAVWAGVFQRGGTAVQLAVEHDALAQHLHCKRAAT